MRSLIILSISAAFALPTLAQADYDVTCESHDYKYKTCRLSESGKVRLKRQISSTACDKGRTWDFNGREVWVDDGCAAEFTVDTRSHGAHDKTGAKVAGAVVGLALLGALAHEASHADDHRYNKDHRYNDDTYQGSRHSSHVPRWMRGTFRGYNGMYGKEVTLTIDGDGEVSGTVGDLSLKGYVNDEKLHFGTATFDVDQTRDGFVTSQTGDRDNEVKYRRVN